MKITSMRCYGNLRCIDFLIDTFKVKKINSFMLGRLYPRDSRRKRGEKGQSGAYHVNWSLARFANSATIFSRRDLPFSHLQQYQEYEHEQSSTQSSTSAQLQ
jgi:hypothetical protein